MQGGFAVGLRLQTKESAFSCKRMPFVLLARKLRIHSQLQFHADFCGDHRHAFDILQLFKVVSARVSEWNAAILGSRDVLVI